MLIDLIMGAVLAVSPVDAANTTNNTQEPMVSQAGVTRGKIRINDSFEFKEAGVTRGKIRIGVTRGKIRI